MPLPNPVTAINPSSGTRRLFVSYSHKDGDLPGEVLKELHLMAADSDLCLARDDIFFDSGMKAGELWNDSIRSAILHADYFLLLISRNSLTSTYCIERELAVAVEQGIPVIPVLLSDCSWENVRVGTKRLVEINAVPKNHRRMLEPIKGGSWPNRGTALKAMASQIADRIKSDAERRQSMQFATAAVPEAGTARHRQLHPLLPYLCNHTPQLRDFNLGMEGWPPTKALIVLIKGVWDDEPEGLWNRLCAQNLTDYGQVMDRPKLLSARPLILPDAMDGKRVRKTLPAELRTALSQALFKSDYRLRSVDDLTDYLRAVNGVQPLYARLPEQPEEGSVAVLRALLDVVEGVAADVPLSRLVFALQVSDAPKSTAPPENEGSPQVVRAPLRKRLKLDCRQRTQIIELCALEPLTYKDVDDWLFAQELVPWEDRLRPELHRLFGTGLPLRMRAFAKAVRPLLGLAPV